MTQPVRLIPMLCIRCQAPIEAGPDEVAWVCAQCQQGQMLDDEKGLAPLDIHFSAILPANRRGKPFWVAKASVRLARQTFKGNQSREMEAFWAQPRRFFVPAYELPLDGIVNAGLALLNQPPALQSGPVGTFEPVTVLPADVKPLAEFLVLTIEAGRRDALKKLDFDLTLEEPELWILP